MKIVLTKKPKNPTIIDGFPGFGLVGTISSEFLLDHLKCEKIGRMIDENIPAMVAIHEGEVVEPLGIFYNKKYNLVIVHAVTAVQGIESKITDAIVDLAEQLKAKEIISVEGIGSPTPTEESNNYYYSSSDAKAKKLEGVGVKKLKEGIVMGTTGLLLLRSKKTLPVTVVFAETHSKLPDSKAAAKVVEVLDKYLNLKVDYKPLLKQAENFEDKLKDLVTKGEQMSREQERKRLSYVG